MEGKEAVADNMTCAEALERYKQRFLVPLGERVKKSFAFIFEKGYDKQCKEGGTDPDPEVLARMTKSYDVIFFQYNEGKKMYTSAYNMVNWHEAVIDELASIYVGMRDNILWEGEVLDTLMEEQRVMLKSYFESIKKILEPIKLEE